MFTNMFLGLFKVKVAGMKKILLADGSDEMKAFAELLSDDELAKMFDFFNQHAEEDDTESADLGMWQDYLGNVHSLICSQTLRKLKGKLGHFFPLE